MYSFPPFSLKDLIIAHEVNSLDAVLTFYYVANNDLQLSPMLLLKSEYLLLWKAGYVNEL